MVRQGFSYILCIAALLSVLLAAGCGGSDSSSDTPQVSEPAPVEPAPEEPVAIEEFDPHWGEVGSFADAASCAACHSAATDGSGVLRYPANSNGEDIGPYAGWQHTVMAHAFNDPYYRAKVQSEVAQFPSLAGTIEDKCLTCHTPMAHTHAHATGMLDSDACLDEEGCYRMESAEADMMAREAVSCTLCHQIDGENLGSTFSGGFHIDSEALTVYGPYFDARSMPMANNTQYSVSGASHIQDSALCASCHDLDTPSVDIRTDEFTGRYFVEQAPYREWRNSSYNSGGAGDQQCQDCHMPEIEGYRTALATNRAGISVPGWPQREAYSQHVFLGGNTYLLQLLKTYRTELGIVDSTTEQGFDREIARNEEFLRQQVAGLSVDRVDLGNNQLDIDVTISNKSGHKLPTSFPSRRVWVNLMVWDDSGKLLFESGTPNADGMLVQDEKWASAACVAVEKGEDYRAQDCYSPHYDVITAAQQVAVYEPVMGDTRGQVSYVLLYGDVYLKDNRIPPVGFSTESADYIPEIAVVGAANEDPDFNRDEAGQGTGRDIVHYQLDWSGLAGSGLQVEAILYYQSLRPSFVNSLVHEGDKIDQFQAMYDQQKPRAIPLQRVTRDYP